MTTENAATITVGSAIAAPGRTVRGTIPVTRLAGGAMLEIPVIVINGSRPGPCLWINAAIHGDEPEGTLTCHSLSRTIKPEQLAGTLVLIPAMNVPAFDAGQRGNPLDTFSYDLNRIYPGRADGYLTERLAWAHAGWMTKVADMEISIHSGGSHSYLSETIFVNEDERSVELAKAMGDGWGLVLSAISPKGNPMAAMLAAGKTGITVELGGRSATSPEEMKRVEATLVKAMLNVLRHYKMLEGAAHYPEFRWKGVQEALLAPVSGVFIPADGVGCQKPMKKGDPIARIVDVWGDTQGELVAPADGMIFGLRALPNVTTGEWCCFYAKLNGRAQLMAIDTPGTHPSRSRDLQGYGATPPDPQWPGEARVALNFVMNFEEGSEYSTLDGDDHSERALLEVPNSRVPLGQRDLAAESMYEYGVRVGFWRLRRLFLERNLPLTVFACAQALERNPEAAAAIAKAEWDICCHGWRWTEHFRLSEEEEKNDISQAIDSLKRTVGRGPSGWYCRYSASEATRRLLVENGSFLYDSDAYNDDLPYWITDLDRPHLVIPYSLAVNDTKLLNGGLVTGGQFFDYLKDTLDMLWEEGKTQPRMMSVGMHLRIVGHPGRAAGLARFLDYAKALPGVWICQREEIAKHWISRFAPPETQVNGETH